MALAQLDSVAKLSSAYKEGSCLFSGDTVLFHQSNQLKTLFEE